MCSPYFFQKTRPTTSYELLEAFSSSLAADRASRWGGRSPSPIPHSNTPHNPISPHIDEDALEGLYFAFSTILRCLHYFLRKTRPTTSYELLEAFSSSLAADRASLWSRDGIPRAHLGAWKPESRSIYHTRAANPNSGWVSPGTIRVHPTATIPIQPAPSRARPSPSRHPRAHTHAPTPTRPHPRAHTQRKKSLKKNLTLLFCVRIVQP